MLNAESTILERFVNDIGAFADIGTEPPTIEANASGATVRLYRLGVATEITINNTGRVVETFDDRATAHANLTALLASDRYGNLREWAVKQAAYLKQESVSLGNLLEVLGRLDGSNQTYNVAEIDDLLCSPRKPGSARVLLIDGPAGIGKTQFIASLADERSVSFLRKRNPLILHVQSRGRTLSHIYDLIASSLQRMRLDVTFDQIPILAKHGLITLAIDGFDELADPDGYDLAWGQINDLIELLRGEGTIILSGRETFIGRDRILRDISALRPDVDDIRVLTLTPPSKGVALNWLRDQGWTQNQLDAIEDFLEPSSLALRPFFLKTLSQADVATRLEETTSTSVLSILMEAMIEREIAKFGEDVERELSPDKRRQFLKDYIGEIARDLAE